MTALCAWFKTPSRYDLTSASLTSVLWYVWLTNPWQVETTLGALTFSVWVILKRRFLAFALALGLALLISFWWQRPAPFVGKIDAHLEVVHVSKIGPIVSWQGRQIFLADRGIFWVGDRLWVRGLVLPVQPPELDGQSFNLGAYLRGLNVLHWIKYPRLELVRSCSSPLCELSKNLATRSDLTSRYGALFLTGQNVYLNGDFYRQLTRLNLSHLFVVSGLHIGLLWQVLTFLLKLTTLNPFWAGWLAWGSLFFYGYWLSYHDSFLRASILLAFYLISSRFKAVKISKVSLVTLASLLMLVARPWLVYRWGFLLAYAASLSLAHGLEKTFKYRFSKVIFFALGPYVATLMLVAKIGGGFNLTAPLLTYWLSPFTLLTYLLTLALYPWGVNLQVLFDPLDQLLLMARQIKFWIQLDPCPTELVWSVETLLYAYLIISEPCNLSTGTSLTGSTRCLPKHEQSLSARVSPLTRQIRSKKFKTR
ncbi:ComEC/Rec2 family competence protein [Mycoplasma sp. ATU-Cv-508]|uniref:ComEC/Rec2 family competence protein n=1 Tax=Mycoplasma sp. ATU-Cv-508 TaxID=2048001 RepID=UPI000FDF31F2